MPKFRDNQSHSEERTFKRSTPCEIIADVSSNHRGDKKRALRIIAGAAQAGATTVKFQLWGPGELWRGETHPDKIADQWVLPEAWLDDLRACCVQNKVEFLVTPFSVRAVNVLGKLRVKRIKIASGDVTFDPMLEEVRKLGVPIIMSVGAADMLEIDKALRILRPDSMCHDVTLLHCIPEYPSTPAHANLRYILDLKEKFGLQNLCHIGLSSHLKEWPIDIVALAYGLDVIEKHIDEDGMGPEAGHSLTPHEFAQFTQAVRQAEEALDYRNFQIESENYARLNYRRDPSDWLRPIKSE